MQSDERLLWKRAKDGDRGAVNKLVETNLPLVIPVAQRYARQGIELDDLIQAGRIGLLKAVQRFRPNLGWKLSTYAVYWIRIEVSREAQRHARVIRIPEFALERLRQHRNGSNGLSLTKARTLSFAKIAYRQDSLDRPLGDDEDGETLKDKVIIHETNGHHEEVDQEVKLALQALDRRHARVIDLRYGLGSKDRLTLEETAQHFGLSRERIRQLEARALTKMRWQLKRHGIGGLEIPGTLRQTNKKVAYMVIDLRDVLEMLEKKRDSLNEAIEALRGISSPTRKDWTRKRSARKDSSVTEESPGESSTKAKKREYMRQWYEKNKAKRNHVSQ